MPRKISLSIIGLLAVYSAAVFSWWLYHWWTRDARADACEPCLPPGVALLAEFVEREADQIPGMDSRPNPNAITVRAKLMELNAYCKDGKIYDSSGTEVRFYRRTSRPHHPQPGNVGSQRFFEETGHRREKEAVELEELRKQFRAVEMWDPKYPI